MTSRQSQTSVEIAKAVPEIPTVIAELISAMAEPDFIFAAQPLELNGAGEVIQNQKNREIISRIELALTASSDECSPTIKAYIFFLATEQQGATGILKPYLVEIIGAILAKGLQINLDGVVLSHLNLGGLSDLNLTGMSAKGATFHHVNLSFLKMAGADFTAATFTDCSLEWAYLDKANITGAVFTKVCFEGTQASELSGNQSGIYQCRNIIEQPGKIFDRDIVLNMTFLAGEKVSAEPDSDNFTLPANQVLPPLLNR